MERHGGQSRRSVALQVKMSIPHSGISMTVIWVLEKSKENGQLFEELIGDFAVRAIASPDSFLRMIAYLGQDGRPDAVVVNGEDLQWELPRILAACASSLPEAHLIVCCRRDLGSAATSQLAQYEKSYLLLQTTNEAFDLVRKIRWILHDQSGNSSQRVYKDLVVDAKRMQVSIVGAAELQQLSAKELRLLLFLLEQPRRCIDRERIRSDVWDGMALSPRTIDTHISRLRKKLSASSVELKSIYGGGYILE